MKKEMAFSNAQVVTPTEVFKGTVRFQEGVITGVERGGTMVSSALDLEGDYLLPGLVELHTDNLEKHFVPRPGVRWPEVAAVVAHDASVAASGITTVLDAIALGDNNENSARIQELDAMAGSLISSRSRGLLRVDHFIHLRCEICYPRVVDLFSVFANEPLVKLVSFMDHTPGQRQFTQINKFYQYYQGKFSLTNPEMEDLILRRKEYQKKYSESHRSLLIQMCRERGLPMASHDDTTVDHVLEAATEGMVICEFPTTVEAAEAARSSGMKILMGAPNLVLGQSHSGNISASELAQRGLLDILSSDYVPASLLHGIFLLRWVLEWPLPMAVRVATLNPVQMARLEDRGAIEVGRRADLSQVRIFNQVPIIKGVWRAGQKIY